jgi:hypothetical protein
MVFRSTDLPTPVGPMTTEELPWAGAKSTSLIRGRSSKEMEKPCRDRGAGLFRLPFMPPPPPGRPG